MIIAIKFDAATLEKVEHFWEFAERQSIEGNTMIVWSNDVPQTEMIGFFFSSRHAWVSNRGHTFDEQSTDMEFESFRPGGAGVYIEDAAFIDSMRPHAPDMVNDVSEFHHKFMQGYNGPPRTMLGDDMEQDRFRVKFMREEVTEFADRCDLIEQWHHVAEGRFGNSVKDFDADRLDACADIVFVAIGTAYLHGWNFNEAWRRVVKANMAKEVASGIGDDIGKWKIRKPIGWMPPDHTDLV